MLTPSDCGGVGVFFRVMLPPSDRGNGAKGGRLMAPTPMPIEEFLERFVEGYLFSDLRSLADIKLPGSASFGAAGYPMVASTMAGIELLGALTSGETFQPKRGRRRFNEF